MKRFEPIFQTINITKFGSNNLEYLVFGPKYIFFQCENELKFNCSAQSATSFLCALQTMCFTATQQSTGRSSCGHTAVCVGLCSLRE